MNPVRYLSSGLLLLLFVSNLFLGIITFPHVSYAYYLIFSIVYFALGLLMMSRMKFAELVGFLATLAIFFIYPLILDFKNLHPWSSGAMSAINAIVFVACFILLLLKIRD
jgi:hypothetical protein